MRWPLPALLVWAAAWLSYWGLTRVGLPPLLSLLVGAALGVMGAGWAAMLGASRWRQLFIGLGFPLSLLASGAAGSLPAWSWLVPLGLLLALYPLRSWRDAPLFPTPRGALAGLDRATGLAPNIRIMDAGCGLGDGLLALRAAFPQAEITGIEWSWLLRIACQCRCALWGARVKVHRADMWAGSWANYDMVYLFQRPESMARAMKKASMELQGGAWLVSLEFEAVGHVPSAKLETIPGKPVWLYRMPLRSKPRGSPTTPSVVDTPRAWSRSPSHDAESTEM